MSTLPCDPLHLSDTSPSLLTSPSVGASRFGGDSVSFIAARRLVVFDRTGAISKFTDCPGSSCSVSTDPPSCKCCACWTGGLGASEAADLRISWRSGLNLMFRAMGAAGAAGCGANWKVEGAEMRTGCSGGGGIGGGAAVARGRGGEKGTSERSERVK